METVIITAIWIWFLLATGILAFVFYSWWEGTVFNDAELYAFMQENNLPGCEKPPASNFTIFCIWLVLGFILYHYHF